MGLFPPNYLLFLLPSPLTSPRSSRAYNGPDSDFVKSVLVPTENLFHAEWAKFAKPEMNGEEKRALREILGRIGKMVEGGWFMADSEWIVGGCSREGEQVI